MIKVDILRNADRSIRGYKVEGHAEFDESGKDIVCAGVSAVVIGMANALSELLQTEVPSKMDRGLLHVTVPERISHEQREKAQLLLDAMVVMLQSIEASYGDYMLMQDSF